MPAPILRRCALRADCARLAEASGHSGMIGGQIIDMLADKSFGIEDVIDLQRRKDRSAV